MLFSGKIPQIQFHVAARLTPRFWVQHSLRFATIRDCSPLLAPFETIRYPLFAIRDYSLFAIRNYSLLWFYRHPNEDVLQFLVNNETIDSSDNCITVYTDFKFTSQCEVKSQTYFI